MLLYLRKSREKIYYIHVIEQILFYYIILNQYYEYFTEIIINTVLSMAMLYNALVSWQLPNHVGLIPD